MTLTPRTEEQLQIVLEVLRGNNRTLCSCPAISEASIGGDDDDDDSEASSDGGDDDDSEASSDDEGTRVELLEQHSVSGLDDGPEVSRAYYLRSDPATQRKISIHKLIKAYLKLNLHGRAYLQELPSVATQRVSDGVRQRGNRLLAAVSDDLNCIYLHLLENPALC